MRKQKTLVLLGIIYLISFNAFCQQEIGLADKFQNKKILAVNRTISIFGDARDALEMNAEKGDGLGILEDLEFDKGIIEVELLGENNPGRSFIGIAFNIQDNSTYEAIYFRPFNFVAEEQIRKDHMVQYIYHPESTWSKLRDERTGEFESEITDPPDPDDWFKVIIKIDKEKVKVFLDDTSKPVLEVDRLTSSLSNKIGIWTGNGSSGRFRNLLIRSE